MDFSKKPLVSRAYWLKCWREYSTGTTASVWRFSLEEPHTGKRMGFASLEALLAYVNEVLLQIEKEE